MDDNSFKKISSISDMESIPSDILDDEPPKMAPTSNTLTMTGSHFLPFASLFPRACAFIVDFAILLIFLFTIGYALSKLNINILPSLIVKQILSEKIDSQTANFPFIPVMILWFFYVLLLNIIYGSLCEYSKLRGTLGKFIFSLYVVDKVGDRCSYFVSILRNAFKGLFLLPFGFGALTCFINSRGKALHDILVGTSVLSKHEKLQFIHIVSLLTTFISIVFISLIFFKEYSTIDTALNNDKLENVKQANNTIGLLQKEKISKQKETKKELNFSQTASNNDDNIKAEDKSKKINLGKLGAFSYNDQSIEINDVIARIILGERNENTIKVEIALFEQKLKDGEKQSLNYVANLLNESLKANNIKPLMIVNINYKPSSQFCENTSILSASYQITPEVADKLVNDESIFNFVDSPQEIFPSKLFSSSCEALMVGKDFSLRMKNTSKAKSNAGINWVFSFSTPLTKYISRAGLNYFSTNNSIALFNKRTSVLTIAQYPSKLTHNDIQNIKTTKMVNSGKLSTHPDTIVTIPIKLPSIPHFKQADLDNSMEKLRLLLKKEYIRYGYSIQFYNKPSDKIRFPNNYYHTINYKAGQTPLTIGGNLENNGKLSCKINGEQIVQANRKSFKLFWKIFFNSPVIVVE